MRSCCGSGSCACKLVEGRRISVTGTGTSQDPFIISTDLALATEDSTTFDLGLSGDGTDEAPWILRVGYASTARLNDLPDVDTPSPTNGQVLAWDTSQNKWVPAAPTTASSGSVNHGNSLSGDGSVGTPLNVVGNSARFISVTASGVGLSDAGVNSLVRVFADAATRSAASPTPAVNTISLLASNPGQIDYWDGSAWQTITNGIRVDAVSAMLELSGAYVDGLPVTEYVRDISTADAVSTDGSGMFEAVPAADLSDYAGVLSVDIAPRGAVPWVAMVDPDDVNGKVDAKVWRLDESAAAAFPVVCTVRALLY